MLTQVLAGGWDADPRRPEEDLWRRLASLLDRRGDSFRVRWVPSHLDEEGRQADRTKALADGITTDKHIAGNSMADRQADLGRKQHLLCQLNQIGKRCPHFLVQ